MTDALEDQEGTVSFGGRTITNLRLADDIDGLAGEEEELAKLVERLNKTSTAYGDFRQLSAFGKQKKTNKQTNKTKKEQQQKRASTVSCHRYDLHPLSQTHTHAQFGKQRNDTSPVT